MYALYSKIKNGYKTDVKVLAVSNSKEKLMEQLPYEVFKWVRSIAKSLDDYEIIEYWLHGSLKPRERWGRGPFDCDEFEVVECPVI